MGRYTVGGVMMGIGGVTAGGCTVGQGVIGMTTLGATSLIALVSIFASAVFGVRYLERGSLLGVLCSELKHS